MAGINERYNKLMQDAHYLCCLTVSMGGDCPDGDIKQMVENADYRLWALQTDAGELWEDKRELRSVWGKLRRFIDRYRQ